MLDRAMTRFSTLVRVIPLVAAALAIATVSADAKSHHRRGHGVAMPASLTDPAKDAAIIEDGATGKVLYSRNPNAERHPASLTKMMTLYLLFDALKKGQITMATPMTVSAHAASQRPTKLHLYPGDSIPVEAAIYAIVIRSANDVAVTIAEALGGTEPHFAEMMTEKARQLGMRNTFFHNASGLPDPLQISTASDLAILGRHLAYDFPQYFHYFASPGFTYRGVTYPTHDNLIGRYEGADGIKTGYTEASGFNLVSSVVRGKTHVIAVVMGGRTARRRDREMMNLLDNAFSMIQANPTLVASATVPWHGGVQSAPAVINTFDVAGGPPRAAPQFGNDAEDEDAAEARPDTDLQQGGAQLAQNEIAAAPVPVPATPAPQFRPAPPPVAPPVIQQLTPQPQARPAPPPPQQVAAANIHVPIPTPRPKHEPAKAPVVLAAYQPPKPTPKPIIGEGDYDDQAATTRRLTAQDWTIQIGAFADSSIARAQLASYAERSMDILGQATRIIVPFKGVDGQTLFRARFGPFVEREAREVCARLTERGQTCFAALATR
jgi:D-alanyl-D-alanine carboxypeptidase